MVEWIGAVLMAGVIAYGAHQVGLGQLSAGDLIGFIIAIGLAQMPIKQLNNAHLKIRAAEAAAERIYRLLDTVSASAFVTVKPVPLKFEKGIEFQDVYLNYGKHSALNGVSFRLDRGRKLALVGPSGGGKTSIVNLLPRLYDPSSGIIRIDGVDTQTFELSRLRSLFSYVTQDVFLFNDSIFENVRFGRPTATEKEVFEALERAHCRDFVNRFAEGTNTLIGDRGMRLSGGERQRLAIARAFLKGAPILLLDEATSSLDSVSERMVQTALDELIEGHTAIIVAHRFSTIQQADCILVVESGRVCEAGTHAELVQERGRYRRLFEQQTILFHSAEQLS